MSDPEHAYQVWTRLISDEELCDATLEGRHRELTAEKRLTEQDLAVLDHFHKTPGTRWNVENLRFRAAMEAVDSILRHMPLTLSLLTGGNEEWMTDLAFEYLAYHRWKTFGQKRLTECERFGEFVRKRVAMRRPLSPKLRAALQFEVELALLLRRTAAVPVDGWPSPPGEMTGPELMAAIPRWSPGAMLVRLTHDLRRWIASGDPTDGEPPEEETTILAVVPSPDEAPTFRKIGPALELILTACVGEASVEEIGERLEEEHGMDPEEVAEVIGQSIEARILAC